MGISFSSKKCKTKSLYHLKSTLTAFNDQNVKAKAAFWLSRGYNNLNDKVSEKIWLNKSAENKFSYYGQNASIKINKFKVIEEV